VPQDGWENKVPALDNGEMIFGLIAVKQALLSLSSSSSEAKQIMFRVNRYLELLASNAKNAFYCGKGLVSAVADVVNNKANPTSDNFKHDIMSGYLAGKRKKKQKDKKCFNKSKQDPYEGEMFVWFLCMFANLSNDECDKIWIVKRGSLKSVIHQSTTIQKGWWFSSHEQWKVVLVVLNLCFEI
jgi:hypothetical protein